MIDVSVYFKIRHFIYLLKPNYSSQCRNILLKDFLKILPKNSWNLVFDKILIWKSGNAKYILLYLVVSR